MRYLRFNTAQRVTVGPFLDKTDGITPEVAITVTSEKLTFVVDEGQVPTLILDVAPTASGGANDMVHITGDDSGYYDLELAAADTNHLGRAMLSLNDVAVHCPVFHEFMIVPANVYDSMVLGSGVGVRADVQGWLGTAPAAVTVAGVPEVDTTHFNGIAGTFASGRPEVNVSHWRGTAAPAEDTAGYPKVTVKNGAGAGEIATTSGGVALTTSGVNAVADQVWDEAASGHVAAGSYGAAGLIIRSGTAQAGAATTITLDASASAVTDFYKNQRIFVVSGTGALQGRIISAYDGTTKVATVATWATNPSSDSVFVILPFGSIPGASAPTAAENADAVWDELRADHLVAASFGQTNQVIRSGTAQAGGASSITLDASASATDDIYNFNLIVILSGTGANQTRQITDYVGSTKVATVNLAWTVNPASDSVFMILPGGLDAATIASIASGVWAATRAGNATAGSFGEYGFADVVRLSGDATAADNSEAFFDGTGYAGTGNVIPTVTTVTTLTGHTAQTGDAFARLGAPVGASISADVAAVKAQTVAIEADTGTDGVVVAAGSKTGYTLSNAGIDALFTRQLTEAYAADGAAPTVAQALLLIQQSLGDFSISGTTLTVKKVDGSTTAGTFTLNDATSPTSITRAS